MRRQGYPAQRTAHAQVCWLACWAALFLGVLTATPTVSAPPQDTSVDQEARARLSKEELRARLQVGEEVQNSIIQGDDLIAILRETTFDSTIGISITDSVIEGGLDFTTLPAIAVEQVKWPKWWTDKDRETWIARKRRAGIDKIHVVANPISIIATTILPRPQKGQNARAVAVKANATFFQKITFEGTTFNGEADFGHTTFEGEAGFWEATFNGDAEFGYATFEGQVGFGHASFNRMADFVHASFEGEAGFWEASFNRMADFGHTTFEGEAGFEDATFNGEAAFGGAHFAKLAFFKDAKFRRRLTLERTLFETYADFRDTQITQLAFNNATSPQIMKGRMDFRRATITEADLQDIVFGQDINFSDTRFGIAVEAKGAHQQGSQTAGDAAPRARQTKCPEVAPDVATVFRFVTFEGHAYFLRTAFCGRTSLERVIFHRDTNFTDATFQGYQASGRPVFSLSYVNFTILHLKWSQLAHPASWVRDTHLPEERIQSFLERGAREVPARKEAQAVDRTNTKAVGVGGEPLEPLSQVLRSLEANFRRQNELDDANEAYFQMKRTELQEARERQSLRQRLPREIEWMLLGIFCGYGTGFWTVVSWTLGFNVLFTLIYGIMGDLQRHSHPEITRDFIFKQRLLDFPHVYLTPEESSAELDNTPHAELLTDKAPTRDVAQKFRAVARTFWDALRFSSGILFKIGYRDTTVSGRIGKCDLRWIVRVEWVLGFYLLAILIYTLTNTWPLLNNLIQGVF